MKNIRVLVMIMGAMVATSAIASAQYRDRDWDRDRSGGWKNKGGRAYENGYREGRGEGGPGRSPQARTGQWRDSRDRQDYLAGYNRGYQETSSQGRCAPAGSCRN